tara:strand:+ start:737 stop:1357 length:621 start_codon:yes stop_codon:yes gene_type:complete
MVPIRVGISLLEDKKERIFMVYIRIKKFKRKNGATAEYAYLVENRWKKRTKKGSQKGARQKVKGYLGKVHNFERISDKEFITHFSVDDVKSHFNEHGMSKVVRDLVRVELLNHGFDETGDFYANGDLAVYMGKDFFIKNLKEEKDRKLVIAMNEGFLCKETLGNLLRFKPKGDEKEVGLQLGNALLGAGLNVPHSVFVEMFERVVK